MSLHLIHKALSTIRRHEVQALLMGGQACVLYGAAEFSRDTDLAIFASPDNLTRLQRALDDLGATVIAVPPFELQYLNRGHAIHFVFGDSPTRRMRLDIMSRMRNVEPFPVLWERRTEMQLDGVGRVDLLSLPDLVTAKKTQRDKDWPMVRRLVDVNYLTYGDQATDVRQRFWLLELRTAELLCEAARGFPHTADGLLIARPLLSDALEGRVARVEEQLHEEEAREREADRMYWAPLRAELEQLRYRLRDRKE